MKFQKAAPVAVLLLLAASGAVRMVQWHRDHPPVTAQDARLRRILRGAMCGENLGNDFSATQEAELAEHFWIASSPRKAQVPSLGNEQETALYFHTSRPGRRAGEPESGEGEIALTKDPAWDNIHIEWMPYMAYSRAEDVIGMGEESYELHPATSRFLRAWLAHQK